MADEIHLESYNPQWAQLYEAERQLILTCMPVPPIRIEHMGSTAVPGLSAKPVIDIIVLVDDLDSGKAAVPALENIGYSYWAANPDTSKMFLAKGLPPAPRRTHHLHIYTDAAEVDRHIRFRDALRADAALRDGYEALKLELAERFRRDREAYTNAKQGFIDAALTRG